MSIAWTQPASGTHPRIWVNATSLPTLQTRIAGSHSAYWKAFQEACGLLGRRGGLPDSYFDDKEAEECAAPAFSYLLDSTRTEHAQRAAEIAAYLANKPFTPGTRGRHYLLAIALVYDWLYSYLTPNLRMTLRKRIAYLVEKLYQADPAEMVWGSSLGNSSFALTALLAILSDGNPAETAQWNGWMNALLDQFDKGPANQTTFLSVFRHFGDLDGGCHRGSGPFGFDAEAEEYFGRLFPAMSSAVGVAWETSEAWWDKSAEWRLWHWRGDRTFHRQGEHESPTPYNLKVIPHLLQTAARKSDAVGQACQWLAGELLDLRNPALQGYQEIWNVLWRDTTRPAVRPTIATMGGRQLRYFARAGKVVIRTDWEEAGTSVTLEVPQYFLGGRQRRRGGHWNVCQSRVPIHYEKGHLDPAQELTPKDAADSAESGHRFTYAQRIPAASVLRIFDIDEPSENAPDSFQRLPFADARYGVLSGGALTISNDGGQLVPKSTTGNRHQPGSLLELLSEPKWNLNTWLITPLDQEQNPTPKLPGYCHAVFNLLPLYYPAKLTTYRRHFLWVKPGSIPGWKYPVLLIYDDLVAHVDAVKGKLTCVLQVQAAAAPSGTLPNLQYDRGAARSFVKVLKPASIEKADITDFQIEGTSFPATNVRPYDDPAGIRTEINPASSGAVQQFLTVVFPCPSSVGAAPTVTLIDDATYIGATIAGTQCKMTKAAPFLASVSASTDLTAPAAPTALTTMPRRDVVDLSWTAPADSDLDFYRVYRGTVSGGPYTLIANQVATASYRDYGVVNGTTYYYVVSAVDTSRNESVKSAQQSALPATGIQGPAPRFPYPMRRLIAALRRRRTDPRYPLRS